MGDLQDNLSADKKILVDWLSRPKTERSSQKELAEKIGVSQPTIWHWKKEQPVIDAVYKKKRQLIKADDLPEILDALIAKAKEGNVQQAKLIFEWLGEVKGNHNTGNAVQVNINTGIPRNEEDIVEVETND